MEVREQDRQTTQTEGILLTIQHLPFTYLLDNIWMVKLLKQRDLSNSSTGYTLCLTWRDWETEMGMWLQIFPFSQPRHSFPPKETPPEHPLVK